MINVSFILEYYNPFDVAIFNIFNDESYSIELIDDKFLIVVNYLSIIFVIFVLLSGFVLSCKITWFCYISI